MAITKCEACGAPIKTVSATNLVVCEYCGVENVNLNYKTNSAQANYAPTTQIVATLRSCGTSVFQKKSFKIYRTYAELVDEKTKFVDIHIDFCDVEKRYSFLGSNIVFKMKNKQKYTIKLLTAKSYELAIQALSGLV